MNTEKDKPRTMPKGGRKGGSKYPREPLQDALTYAKKLVNKTHTGKIAMDVLNTGVFGVGATSSVGDIRASALKQYGLLFGDKKTQFSASELARRIAAAPSDEVLPLYKQCALTPTIFKKLYDTYHGDTVPRAKLKQRASELKVHPEEAEKCVEVYVSSMLTAQLVTVDGDRVIHAGLTTNTAPPVQPNDSSIPAGEENNGDEEVDDLESVDSGNDEIPLEQESNEPRKPRSRVAHGAVTVTVNLDSVTDHDKLAKQLALLRKYGVL